MFIRSIIRKQSCLLYTSMATFGKGGFHRAIHNIENSPFRTKFERDVEEMKGNIGIGCISDFEPQPLLIQSHLGSFAITTVGKINNLDALLNIVYENGHTHFQEMSGGQINATELVASLICKKETIVEGIRYVQEIIDEMCIRDRSGMASTMSDNKISCLAAGV